MAGRTSHLWLAMIAALALCGFWITLLNFAVGDVETNKQAIGVPAVILAAPLPVSSPQPLPTSSPMKAVLQQTPTAPPSTATGTGDEAALSKLRERAAQASALSSRVKTLEKDLADCQRKRNELAAKKPAAVAATPKNQLIAKRASEPATLPLQHSGHSPIGRAHRIPVIVFTFNRPDRLTKCLELLSRVMPRDSFDLYVSQDGPNDDVSAVIESFRTSHSDGWAVSHITHVRDDSGATPEEIDQGWQPYYAIAHHYKSSINKVFATAPYKRIIVIEDDLEVAPDFFSLMNATSPLFDIDKTLYCVSGFNDNGSPEHVSDPRQLYRTDFFPGLGWMTSREIWSELERIWPKGFWDDWMRQPDKRKGRTCIRPEVPRSMTRCSEQGVSAGQFCEHLEKMQLSMDAVDWSREDLSYLGPQQYAELVKSWLSTAKTVRTVFEVDSIAAAEAKIAYDTNEDIVTLEEQIGLMSDFKDGIPRTAYRGVVTTRFRGKRLHLVPTKELYAY